jgi:hypothetical protein
MTGVFSHFRPVRIIQQTFTDGDAGLYEPPPGVEVALISGIGAGFVVTGGDTINLQFSLNGIDQVIAAVSVGTVQYTVVETLWSVFAPLMLIPGDTLTWNCVADSGRLNFALTAVMWPQWSIG